MNKLLCSFSTDINDFPDENWKDVPNYEGLYKISTYGRIKCMPNQRTNWQEIIYFISIGWQFYKNIQLYKKGEYQWFGVHVLMGLTFIPNPDNKPVVNHKNTIKFDNTLGNLEWSTYSENTLHAIEMGMKPSMKGEMNLKSVLKENQVIDIVSSQLPSIALAQMYNVTLESINSIKCGFTWGHLTGIKYKRMKLLPEQVLDIFHSTNTTKELCKQYDIIRQAVEAIKTGQNGGHITGKIYIPKPSQKPSKRL